MKKNDMDMLILSCDAFSDLWDGNIKLLEKYWPDRQVNTYIVTEGNIDKKYDNVNLIKAGNKEWSERLKYALNQVKSDYVLITLDDYYIINKIDNYRIDKLLNYSKNNNIDYLRLFLRPKKSNKEYVNKEMNLRKIDTSITYSVNLYTAIWKKSFLEKMIDKPLNAWKFEVLLHNSARRNNGFCVVDCNNDYPFLDVVRKGKILHKANRYFKKNKGIYNGTRDIQSMRYEISLFIKTQISRHIPSLLRPTAKVVARKMGYEIISDIEVGD